MLLDAEMVVDRIGVGGCDIGNCNILSKEQFDTEHNLPPEKIILSTKNV